MSDKTDEQVEDFLAHYGVKGMKWGKRKGGGPGPVGRARARVKEGAVDQYERDRAGFQALRKGENLNAKGKAINITNRLTMGKKLTNKYYDAKIRDLDKRIDDLSTGKASIIKKIEAVQNIGTMELNVQKK